MQVQLIVEDDHIKGQVIPVNVSSFIIGRAKGSHLRSPSTHVSRQHCIIHTENNSVTIQDLGGENGTYVNGKRISTLQTLQNGDKLAVGTHTFIISIVSPAESKPPVTSQEIKPPEVESELMFDVRYEGQLVSVTKNKLFDLAKKGKIHPDDLIVIAGTKVFADSIEGIVFGNQSSAVAPPPVSVTSAVPAEPAVQPDVWKTDANTNLYDTAVSESSGYVPSPQRRSLPVFEEKIVTPKERIDSSEKIDLLTRGKQLLAIIIAAAGLMGGFWYFYSGEKKPSDIFFVVGTVTLNGEPIQGVSVTLNPRGEGGTVAGGQTDSRGDFKVTTGAAPVGSGAKAGEYDVTFSKVKIDENSGKTYVIPQKYERVSTSGLDFIKVIEGEKNLFAFELTSTDKLKPTKENNVQGQKATPTNTSNDVRKAGERFVLNIKNIEYAFRWCPAGTFMMGSPSDEPGRQEDEVQHQVTLTRGFWMLETEVTHEMWTSVTSAMPHSDEWRKFPVQKVSWDECQEYITKLNQTGQAPRGFKFALPTEAQWEYACRAGTKTAYYFGNELTKEQANTNFGRGASGRMQMDVAGYPPNAWGLYDMHGGVFEWCEDWFGDYAKGNVTDPIFNDQKSAHPYEKQLLANGAKNIEPRPENQQPARVARGGNWNRDVSYCRSASRHSYNGAIVGFGLRLCLTSAEK